MGHGIVLGIDHVAATRADTIWHRNETLQDGRLVQVNYNGDPEATTLEMTGVVLPKSGDNDYARSVALQTVEGISIPTHVALLSRSGRVLNIVGSEYHPVPFTYYVTELLLALARSGGVPETLGTYDAGVSMFSSFQVADEWQIPGDKSLTRPYFDLLAHHGEGASIGSFSAVRLECRNKSMMFSSEHEAIKDAAERVRRSWFAIYHRKNAEERIRDAVKYITDGRARAESERALMLRLAAKHVSRAEVGHSSASARSRRQRHATTSCRCDRWGALVEKFSARPRPGRPHLTRTRPQSSVRVSRKGSKGRNQCDSRGRPLRLRLCFSF